MSGTRSPFRKGPVTEALLVSHGQPSAPETGEAHLQALAQQVSNHLPDWIIRSATLAAPQALERALAACRTKPLVLPVFMTDGWFTRKALPQRLGTFSARQMAPLGTHLDLPRLTARLLRRAVEQKSWLVADTEILIAAHGSATGSAPSECTLQFAAALARWLPAREIRIGFLAEAPCLARVAAHCGPKSLALPFFAGAGGHVNEDVPDALDEAGFRGVRLPALGDAWFTPELIAQSLRSAAIRTLAA